MTLAGSTGSPANAAAVARALGTEAGAAAVGAATGAFSVLEVLDTSAQREAIREYATDFDTAVYINEAVAYAIAQGYKGVHLPAGLWLLNGARQGTKNTILKLMPAVSWYGTPGATILKLADGYTTAGDYRILGQPEPDVDLDDVTIYGLIFDGNGANNAVLGSSGGNIRGAYPIKVEQGKNISISYCGFLNSPARNAINLGKAPPVPDYALPGNVPPIIGGRIVGNWFRNIGAASPGGTAQNDCSIIYSHLQGGLIAHNQIHHDSQVPSSLRVVGYEIHGQYTDVIGNTAIKCSHGGNAVAEVHHQIGNRWIGNQFIDFSVMGHALYALNDHLNIDLVLDSNVYRPAADTSGLAGLIYQGRGTASHTGRLVNARIINNTLGNDDRAATGSFSGIDLVSYSNITIENNTIKNCAAYGINISDTNETGLLPAERARIDGNNIENCGIQGAGVYGIRVRKPADARVFHGVRIGAKNRIWRQILVGDAVPSVPMRGISIDGAITGVVIEGNIDYENINRSFRVVLANTTGQEVTQLPRESAQLTASTPKSGAWNIGDKVRNTDSVVGASAQRVCTTAGSATSGTRADSTAVKAHDWYNLSDGKRIKYLTSGTTGVGEPFSGVTTIFTQATDGTATAMLMDTAAAAFVTEGGRANGLTVMTNADVTLGATSARTQRLAVALTADRAVTLTATGAAGDYFLIVRTAASTGAFNLNVGTGPLKALATGTWCRVEYDGTAWFLAAYGSL